MPSLRCYPSHRFSVGGYGILPYPRRPLKSFHRFHRSPQISLRGCSSLCCTNQADNISSHRIHGIHRSFWQRRASHGFHRSPQMVRLRIALPQNSRNSQKFLVEKSLPQMPTEVFGVEEPPTDFTDAHRYFWRRRASHRYSQMRTDA